MQKQTSDKAPSKASKAPQTAASENEGEGSSTGTKKYDAGVRDFVKSGAVEAAAKDAEKAVDGAEGAELTEAETVGKRGGANAERGSKSTRGKA